MHNLKTNQPTAKVEAFATANDGSYAYKYGVTSARWIDAKVEVGDAVSLTAVDGGVFIGEVADHEPEYGVLYLDLM